MVWSGPITIPSSVMIISSSAFYQCTALTSVTMTGGIILIGSSAFYYCSSLTAVNIPDGVMVIGNTAFNQCDSLTSISIPGSVISIGNGAFSGCDRLSSLTISEGVSFIGPSAFNYCPQLKNVSIPASVTSVGGYAFNYCQSMTRIEVDSSNSKYSSLDGVLYDKVQSVLIQCPTGKTGSVIVPESVKWIDEGAFYYCTQLTSIDLPNGTTSIGRDAFFGCYSLVNLTIPKNVTMIGSNAFNSCSLLTNVTIPSGVTFIGEYAFLYCYSLTAIEVEPSNEKFASIEGVLYDMSMTILIQCPGAKQGAVDIPNGVSSIGPYAFSSCGLVSNVTIPNSVMHIGDYAFSYCYSLTNATLPPELEAIGERAFQQCSLLGSVTIPSSTTSIGYSVFSACTSMTTIEVDPTNPVYCDVDGVLYDKEMTTLIQCPGGKVGAVVIPNGVTHIEKSAFNYCQKVTNVTIPKGVLSIGDYAFGYSPGITEIHIPETVSIIGYQAFISCKGMTGIYVDAANPFYASHGGILYNKAMTTLIQCPAGMAGTLSIPHGVTTIEDYAFYWGNLTSLVIPGNVTTIGYRGLDGMSSLTQLRFLGDAPLCEDNWISNHNDSLVIYFAIGSTGFTTPTWYDIDTLALIPVTGRVVDGGGVVQANILVTLDGEIWVNTDVNGAFTLIAPEGDHILTFFGEGFKNRTISITVTGNSLELEEVELEAEGESGGGSDNTLLIAAAVGAFVAIVMGSLAFLWWRKYKS